jgi:hypothetical protein
MEPTLHISRSRWIVERPHATGSDWGPGRYPARGERVLDAAAIHELETVHLPYYRNAGFRIVDTRPKAKE